MVLLTRYLGQTNLLLPWMYAPIMKEWWGRGVGSDG